MRKEKECKELRESVSCLRDVLLLAKVGRIIIVSVIRFALSVMTSRACAETF